MLSSGQPTVSRCVEQPGHVTCKSLSPFERGSSGLTRGERLSVGHSNAIKQILLATYRALSQLPPSHLHPDLVIPALDPPVTVNGNSNGNGHSTPSSPLVRPVATKHHLLQQQNELASPYASRPSSPTRAKLPPINVFLFQYVWLGLAGISTPADSDAFRALVMRDLCVSEARVKVTNGESAQIEVQVGRLADARADVNILAAPALDLPGVDNVVAVVCGTGTVGRTIRVGKVKSAQSSPALEGVDSAPQGTRKVRQLPLEDVAVARGWGYL